MKSFIEKIEAEFDHCFHKAQGDESFWSENLKIRPSKIKAFIRTALADFVKLAQEETNKMKSEPNDEALKYGDYDDQMDENFNRGFNLGIAEAQSTLSCLLSGEVEK